MMQECLGENNRDWRLCQKGISDLAVSAFLLSCMLHCILQFVVIWDDLHHPCRGASSAAVLRESKEFRQ